MAQRLAQHLIARGLLPAQVVEAALKAMAARGGGLDTVLLEAGAVSEAGILQAASDVSGVRLVNLADFEANPEAAGLLSVKLARQLRLAPLSQAGDSLHVASSYPIPKNQLRDLGFLLGKKLELWVALECRIKEWQAVVYGGALEPRFARLLASLARAAQASDASLPGDETLSRDVLDRVARGIVDEPVLLDRPKRRSEAWPPDEQGATGSAPDLAAALGGQAAPLPLGPRAGRALAPASTPAIPTTRDDLLRTLPDATALAATPPRITFPGGVAPARSGPRVALAHPLAPQRAQPEAASRPASEQRSLGAPSVADLALGLDPDLDFSGVNQAPPPAAARPLPPRFEELQALAATPPARRRSAPRLPRLAPAPREVALPEVTGTHASGTWADEVPDAAMGLLETLPGWLTEGQAPAPSGGGAPGADAAPTPPADPGHPDEAGPPPPAAQAPPVGPILPAPPGLGASSAAGWSLAEARQSLKASVHDRERMVAVTLDYGRRAFEFVAAFAVLKGNAVGWEARGPADAVERVAGASIPLDAASVFRTVAVARGSYLGPLPPDALSRHYLAQLGRVPRTVFLWPVEVQRRLVVVLYGDCGPRPVSQRRLADFILFCQDLPAAFHELMLFRRQDPHSWGALVERQAAAARPGPPPVVPGAQGQGEWFDGLLSLLTGPEPDQRTAAMQELLRTPAASARALSDAFPGPSAWTRLPVVEVPDPDELGPLPGALARLGDEGARALAPLLDAQDSDTRYLALLTAGSVPSPDVVGGVLRGLFDLEPDISSAARAAAAALKHLPALQGRLPELRRELVASDPLRRSLAARALGVLHDRPSIEGLINLSASEDGLCAQAAADALKELTRLDLGPHPTAWARWWARARDLRRVDWLAAALESQDFDLRLAAIEELSRAFQDNLGYFADSPDDERAPAAARWRQALAARPDLDL